MARKRKAQTEEIQEAPKRKVQNKKPSQRSWSSFEQCWASCVKNGSPVLMAACKAHVTSLGWIDDQNLWLKGISHFGVETEK